MQLFFKAKKYPYSISATFQVVMFRFEHKFISEGILRS